MTSPYPLALIENLSRTGECNPAIVTGTGILNHRDLAQHVGRVATSLRTSGVRPDDRIVVAPTLSAESAIALLSCLSTAACVPVNPSSSAADLERTLRQTRSTVLLSEGNHPRAVLEAALAAGLRVVETSSGPIDPGDIEPGIIEPGAQAAQQGSPGELALIFTSSGSTAAPRIIPVTQSMLCHRAHNVRNFLALTASDRCMGMMPAFHGAGLLIPVLGSLFAGGSVALPGTFPILEFERIVLELEPTWVAVPAPLLDRLLSDECVWSGQYRRLRAFFTGGATSSVKSIEAMERKFGAIVQNGYGSTECGGISANPMPPATRKRASVGLSIGPKIAIFDSEGHAVAAGITGEIAVRGPGVFRGYETESGLDTSTLTDSWHHTGDVGYQDTDGFLFLTGRLNEVINRGGEKFSPEEVEACLRRHPDVADTAVFPILHAVLGQEPAALVVLRSPNAALDRPNPGGPDVDNVRDFAALELSHAKMPRAILPVHEIPRNAAGKVPRRQLAELYKDQLQAAMAARPAYEPPRTPLENYIADLWSGLLKVHRIGVNDRFADLGGDSMRAVSMLSTLNATQGCEIGVRELWRSPTVATLARLASSRPGPRSSLLFPVSTSGSLPPLFSILPGWFPEIEHLGRYLGQDRPLYALIPDPRPGGAQEGLDANEIVEECERAIRSVRSAGPYLLIGRSVGGIVAVHIANRLQQTGESVAFVGLIDAHYPGVPGHRNLPAPLRLLEQFISELIVQPRAHWRSWILGLPGRALRRRARLRAGATEAERAARATNTGLEWIFTDTPNRPFEGRLTLFAAEQSPLKGFIDRRIYWSRAATQGLELHLLPGTHNLMTQEPLLPGFAEVLRGCLERATRV